MVFFYYRNTNKHNEYERETAVKTYHIVGKIAALATLMEHGVLASKVKTLVITDSGCMKLKPTNLVADMFGTV